MYGVDRDDDDPEPVVALPSELSLVTLGSVWLTEKFRVAPMEVAPVFTCLAAAAADAAVERRELAPARFEGV